MARHEVVVAIAKALAHPIRIEIMEAIGDEGLSPIRFANSRYEPLNNVSYHFTALRDYGILAVVAEHPRRGAIEHVYGATDRGKALQRLLADLG